MTDRFAVCKPSRHHEFFLNPYGFGDFYVYIGRRGTCIWATKKPSDAINRTWVLTKIDAGMPVMGEA